MKLPVNVYSALNGMQWLTAEHLSLSNRGAVRQKLGPLVDFNMEEHGYRGVFVEDGVCYIYACFKALKFDSVGRDASYFVFTHLPQADVYQLDIDAVLKSAVFTLPRKVWPESAEVDFPECSILEREFSASVELGMESFVGDASIEGQTMVWRLAEKVPMGGTLRLQMSDRSPNKIKIEYNAPKFQAEIPVEVECVQEDKTIIKQLQRAEATVTEMSGVLQRTKRQVIKLENEKSILYEQLQAAMLKIQFLEMRWEKVKTYFLYTIGAIGLLIGVIAMSFACYRIITMWWLNGDRQSQEQVSEAPLENKSFMGEDKGNE